MVNVMNWFIKACNDYVQKSEYQDLKDRMDILVASLEVSLEDAIEEVLEEVLEAVTEAVVETVEEVSEILATDLSAAVYKVLHHTPIAIKNLTKKLEKSSLNKRGKIQTGLKALIAFDIELRRVACVSNEAAIAVISAFQKN